MYGAVVVVHVNVAGSHCTRFSYYDVKISGSRIQYYFVSGGGQKVKVGKEDRQGTAGTRLTGVEMVSCEADFVVNCCWLDGMGAAKVVVLAITINSEMIVNRMMT